ncbi:MAG: LacI family DNA-binding transcriptional regulator [Kiritimatiellae bacterium]|jgi:LacI family transcriptional regulator|nr:LacI family DNA-binding transcriptional regulator [Kiritimatiellia bacterium]
MNLKEEENSDNLVLKTQADLAKHLGLARMTVQKALSGHPSVNEKTRCLVAETAKKHGYRPNRAALSMRSGIFGAVTVVGATERGVSHIPSGILQGINNKANEEDLRVLLGECFYEDADRSSVEPVALKELITDGLLVHYYIDITERIKAQVEEYRLPFVWLNAGYETNSVRPDDFSAGKDAVERLIALGHKRIAYVSYHGKRHYSIKERYKGALKAIEDVMIENFSTQFTDSYTTGTCFEDACKLLAVECPTAVICHEVAEAIAICAAADKFELSIPEDLSVVVFHQEVARATMGQCLSTYVVPFQSVGIQAIDMIVKRISTGKSYESVKIPFEFVDDGSLAAAKK